MTKPHVGLAEADTAQVAEWLRGAIKDVVMTWDAPSHYSMQGGDGGRIDQYIDELVRRLKRRGE